MTAALEGGEWSAARPGRTLPPWKTRYPFDRRLGGSQGRSGRAESLVSTGIRSRTVQPVAQSLYRLSYPAHGYIKDIMHLKSEVPLYSFLIDTLQWKRCRVMVITTNHLTLFIQLSDTISRAVCGSGLLWVWVRIPLASWLSVCCECCMLSGRGLCVGLSRLSKEVLASVVCPVSVMAKPR